MELILEGKFSSIHLKDGLIHKNVIDKYFLHEVEIHSNLVHENIVLFLNSYSENGLNYIVMEYCEKRSLRERNIDIPKNEIFLQIANGLNYIHNNHIIHRDIKPENIFVTNNTIKIGDFGLSIKMEKKFIKSGAAGTRSYSSPEIYNKQYYNHKTDMWSLGCTFFYILTGRRLFSKNGDFEYYLGSNIKERTLLKCLLTRNHFYRIDTSTLISFIQNKNAKIEEDPYEIQNDIKITNAVIEGNILKTDENIDSLVGVLLIFEELFAMITNVINKNEVEFIECS